MHDWDSTAPGYSSFPARARPPKSFGFWGIAGGYVLGGTGLGRMFFSFVFPRPCRADSSRCRAALGMTHCDHPSCPKRAMEHSCDYHANMELERPCMNIHGLPLEPSLLYAKRSSCPRDSAGRKGDRHARACPAPVLGMLFAEGSGEFLSGIQRLCPPYGHPPFNREIPMRRSRIPAKIIGEWRADQDKAFLRKTCSAF
jgi:hypothetical protein